MQKQTKNPLIQKTNKKPFIQKTRNLILFSPGTAEVLKILKRGTCRNNRSSFDEIGFASNPARICEGGDLQKARDQKFVQKISCIFPTKKERSQRKAKTKNTLDASKLLIFYRFSCFLSKIHNFSYYQILLKSWKWCKNVSGGPYTYLMKLNISINACYF